MNEWWGVYSREGETGEVLSLESSAEINTNFRVRWSWKITLVFVHFPRCSALRKEGREAEMEIE